MTRRHLLIAAALLIFAPILLGLPISVSGQQKYIYGMTEEGGENNLGVLFQFNPADSTYTKTFDFDGTAKGSNPYGSLMQASDGKLYGMSYAGGANNYGVLFQYDPVTSTYTKKLDFDDTTNGSNPRGALMQASDGNLYGMTERGGTYDAGVLFQYNPASSTYAVGIEFGEAGVTGVANCYGSLVEASDKKLYGMSYGTTDNYGVLFRFDPVTSGYVQEVYFDGVTSGAYPVGSLIQASDGNLYGMTYQGGAGDAGVLFTYVPSVSVYAKKHDFGAPGVSGQTGVTGPKGGSYPAGSLLQASDGMLYGMTQSGGIYNYGVLFQYNPLTFDYTKIFDFDGAAKGRNPYGSLIQSSDGNLYGMTKAGGANGYGVLFKFNPVTLTYTKQLDFTGANGKYPMFSHVIEIAVAIGINEFSDDNYISLSPNPVKDKLYVIGYKLYGSVELIIYNTLGEAVLHSPLFGRSAEGRTRQGEGVGGEADVSMLPPGIYFLQLIGKNESRVGKFIKE